MLTATFEPARAADYRRPGGAWDRPTLDALLTDPAPAALQAAVAGVAGGLRAAGVGPGDVVAWQAPNRPEVVLAYRACWRIGAVAAPIHHQAGTDEVARALEAVQPRVVLDLDALPLGHSVTECWSEPEQLAAVLWTSGSSGAPKGVLHTQATLAYKAAVMGPAHGLGPDDCILMPAPCAHISGLLNGITLPGAVPFRSILMPRWDPDRALDIIASQGVTFMVGPPTFFRGLMDAPSFDPARVASLRLISSGGAGVSAAFVEEAEAKLGARVKRTYGSTEAPTVLTDGRPIAAAELRIAPDGELLVRGPEVCVGYLDPTDNVDAFTADGWFRTGDLATADDGGRIDIVGRTKDVIIRGGENISTAEIEAVARGASRDPPGRRGGLSRCAHGRTRRGVRRRRRSVRPRRGTRVVRGARRRQVQDAGTRARRRPTLPLLATGKPDRVALRDAVVPG